MYTLYHIVKIITLSNYTIQPSFKHSKESRASKHSTYVINRTIHSAKKGECLPTPKKMTPAYIYDKLETRAASKTLLDSLHKQTNE